MLKFFRRIRQKLLNEGSLKKYSAYALGEILLVVVGILIALQLNNWNERRKSDQAFEQLLDVFEADLYENIAEANFLIHQNAWRLEIIRSILKGKVTKEMYESDILPRHILIYNRLDVSDEDAKLILEKQEQFPKIYSALVPQLKQYIKILNRQKVEEAYQWEKVHDFIHFLTTNTSLPGKNGLIGEELEKKARIDFYLNDSMFLNYLAAYEVPLRGNLLHTEGFRAACTTLLGQIKHIREEFGPQEEEQFFQAIHLVPFQALDCHSEEEIQAPMFPNRYTYFPLWNKRNQEVTVFKLNTKKEKVHSMTLKPGEMTVNFGKTSSTGDFVITEGSLLDVEAAHDCIGRYVVSVGGFLIID